MMKIIIQLLIVIMFPFTSIALEPITKVVVDKSKRQLSLLSGEKVIHTYKIALGGNPLGHKKEEGDNKTPEGCYTIDWRNPNSKFYKSLHISYPNAKDRAQAKYRGVSPGNAIFIHGLPENFAFLGRSHAIYDWTLGCIAVTNEQMDEIWKLVKNGTEIEILP